MSQKHARPPMTRRSFLTDSEQTEREVAAMKAKLQSRTHRDTPDTAENVFGRSLMEQQEALQKLTDAPPIEQGYRDERNRPVEPITQAVQLPSSYRAEAPVLEWEKPVRWADGSGYVRSTGGTYSVVKERSGDVWRYVAFHGINALGVSQTAVDGQGKCLIHFLEACEG
jgi:hypothetical protein